MKEIPVSLFLGPLFLITFFVACAVIVVGIKMLILYFKKEPKTPTRLSVKPKRRRAENSAPPPKPVRSIEIDPDQVDKIYVKKVS
ncbi:MAG: hypothetical protein IJU83_01690 [Clostridia bacterium]|nr:hypothetical protein [Clostridia bacterium]